MEQSPQDANLRASKRCTKCGEDKPLSEFSKHKGQKDGLQSNCKSCQRETRRACLERKRESDRAWREANRERVRETARTWREANRERVRENKKAWRAANPERAREYSRAWIAANPERAKAYYAANRERVQENVRAWRASNPERVREYRRTWQQANPEAVKANQHRRRARKLEARGTYTPEDIQLQYRSQKGKCWHCGIDLNGEYHVDHLIPLSRGGTNWPNNLVCSCAKCNLSKNDKLPSEWNGKLF